jgi:hypothetical protein
MGSKYQTMVNNNQSKAALHHTGARTTKALHTIFQQHQSAAGDSNQVCGSEKDEFFFLCLLERSVGP